MRGATGVILRRHQILRLPRKVTVMTDPRDIWNVIYNAQNNRCHPPTSPNTAPATQSDCRDWSSWHMKRYPRCTEQQVSSSNITEYCACHTNSLWNFSKRTLPKIAPAMNTDTCKYLTSLRFSTLLLSTLLYSSLLVALLDSNLLSDESILRRIYSQVTKANLFSYESNLWRIYSQTNLFSGKSILLRIYNLWDESTLRIYPQTNLLSNESILLLFGSRSYIGSMSSELPFISSVDSPDLVAASKKKVIRIFWNRKFLDWDCTGCQGPIRSMVYKGNDLCRVEFVSPQDAARAVAEYPRLGSGDIRFA